MNDEFEPHILERVYANTGIQTLKLETKKEAPSSESLEEALIGIGLEQQLAGDIAQKGINGKYDLNKGHFMIVKSVKGSRIFIFAGSGGSVASYRYDNKKGYGVLMEANETPRITHPTAAFIRMYNRALGYHETSPVKGLISESVR